MAVLNDKINGAGNEARTRDLNLGKIASQCAQDIVSNQKRSKSTPLRKLSDADIDYIRSSTLSSVKLAEHFGLNPCTIRRARHGQTFSYHGTPPKRLKRGGWAKADLPCKFKAELFSLPGEEWRPAAGWEVHYRVSNMGRVYSLHQTGRMVIGMCVNGSYRILKTRSEGRKANLPVHCMVLEAFVGPRPSPAHEGCHNNGKPGDNRLSNLRWDTAAGNQADRIRHGTSFHGKRLERKLTPDLVRQIRAMSEITLYEWARRLGCSITTISSARNSRSWKHIPPADSTAECRA